MCSSDLIIKLAYDVCACWLSCSPGGRVSRNVQRDTGYSRRQYFDVIFVAVLYTLVCILRVPPGGRFARFESGKMHHRHVMTVT